MARTKDNAPRSGHQRSQRQLRVGEVIRHALVEVLARGELRDPVLVGQSVTVTEVRVSPDLRNAAIFVMPLGGEQVDEIVAALGRASPFLRRMIGQTVTMKYLPALSFVADGAFDQSSKIDTLLRSPEVAQDLTGTDPQDHDDIDPGRVGLPDGS
jgi:ribosome-binding factor A